MNYKAINRTTIKILFLILQLDDMLDMMANFYPLKINLSVS